LCQEGIVFLSDSRSSAGMDNINVHRKMHIFEKPGERVICLLSSGNLSLTHSTLSLIEEDCLQGRVQSDHPNLLNQQTLFETARYVGQKVREVAEYDRKYLERDDFKFNVHFLVGGQIKELPHQIYYIYPQGNVIHASEETPFLQIGESKYGKPILDRGYKYTSSLSDAVRFGMLSMDSTMKSNVSVGPPIDLLCYEKDSLCVKYRKTISEGDPYLHAMRTKWSQGLIDLVQTIPPLSFEE
jgi:putative proteasome-type protease